MPTICCRRKDGADRRHDVITAVIARLGTDRGVAVCRTWPAIRRIAIDKQPKPDQKIPPADAPDKKRDNDKALGIGILPEEDEDDVEGQTGR